MRRVDSLEKTLMLGGIGGRRKRGWQRMRWLDGITDSMDSCEFEWTLEVGDGQGGLACWNSWGHKELDTTEQLNWMDVYTHLCIYTHTIFLSYLRLSYMHHTLYHFIFLMPIHCSNIWLYHSLFHQSPFFGHFTWTSYLHFIHLSFLIWKMRLKIIPTS